MRRLSNYLRKHRKRLGLSQDDVAFLLGTLQGAKLSRYEQFARIPKLETALALEAIFQVPVRQLFAGLYEQAAEGVVRQAGKLITIADHGSDPKSGRRAQSLRNLVKRDEI